MAELPQAPFSDAMRRACAAGRAWLGATSPNPAVGTVALDAAGNILATAAHRRAGEAHAEAQLIAICREQNILDKVATLCVTLEPCNHHGHTPPCTDAIIEAGIKHVVIGTRDINPHVAGGGIEKLRQAGVEVIEGVNEDECKQLIHAFAYNMKTGKPWITVKRAINSSGTMMPIAGQKTFTSPESLKLAHRLRKKADAIITGSGTILADDPLFTVRHVDDYPGKQRFLSILDRRGLVPDAYRKAAEERGFSVIIHKDIGDAVADLAHKGAQDILVEAGPTLSEAMLDSNLWTMFVTVTQGNPDSVNVEFNMREPLPFVPGSFRWESFLPA